jgi:DNA-directed RNA polymerase subunit omega
MTTEILKGIVSPSIDNLLGKVDSKYELVMFAANRARQINQYYAELQAGSLFNNVGPLVDATVDEKALTIALREIDQDKLVKTAIAQ